MLCIKVCIFTLAPFSPFKMELSFLHCSTGKSETNVVASSLLEYNCRTVETT